MTAAPGKVSVYLRARTPERYASAPEVKSQLTRDFAVAPLAKIEVRVNTWHAVGISELIADCPGAVEFIATLKERAARCNVPAATVAALIYDWDGGDAGEKGRVGQRSVLTYVGAFEYAKPSS